MHIGYTVYGGIAPQYTIVGEIFYERRRKKNRKKERQFSGLLHFIRVYTICDLFIYTDDVALMFINDARCLGISNQ